MMWCPTTQHLWFVPDDHECDRHLSETEQGTTAAFPEVTGDGAARKLPSDTDHDNPARFVSERQELERTHAGITTEGAPLPGAPLSHPRQRGCIL